MKVLIACEESQIVCAEFRKLGHEAYSCDILPASGNHPEWHIQGDVLEQLDKKNWDLMIAHPPCTYLAVTGNKWFYHPDDKHLPTDRRRPHPRFPNRQQQKQDAIDFFMRLATAKIPHIAVENPVGIMSTVWRKPDQYVQPFWFGDPHSKKTGLWLKDLPLLEKTNVVEPEMYVYKDGRKDPMWHVETMKLPAKERSIARSKTFPGFAKQLAVQYSNYILEKKQSFKKDDYVKLPFNETGVIVKVHNNIVWGFKYDVKIITATLSDVGEIADFKAEQLELLKK